MKRIAMTLLLVAVFAGCSDNAARPPLTPSAIAEPNGAGPGPTQRVVSWFQFVEAPRAHVQAIGEIGPSGLTSSVSGSTVTFVWQAPPGVSVSQYLIEAGSAPGLSDIALFLTGSTATSITFGSVPNNTYYVRIRGVVGNFGTQQSNEVVVIVGTPAACIPTVSPTTINAANAASTATVNVTSTCAWTAFSGVPWITIASGASGAGNGVVTLNIGANAGAGRQGLASIAGQSVTIVQGGGTLSPSFQLFDPSTQAGPTTECRINANPRSCELRSTSFTAGRNAIVKYDWNVQYTYDAARVFTASGASPTFSFSDICGLPGSSAEGASQPLAVTLTITDDNGDTTTATSGAGNQPALTIRLFTCS